MSFPLNVVIHCCIEDVEASRARNLVAIDCLWYRSKLTPESSSLKALAACLSWSWRFRTLQCLIHLDVILLAPELSIWKARAAAVQFG